MKRVLCSAAIIRSFGSFVENLSRFNRRLVPHAGTCSDPETATASAGMAPWGVKYRVRRALS